MLGKTLITHQTGPNGKEVKRLYIEESSTIKKEFYLSCLIDRASSRIAFISSDQGGMDIEEVAKTNPEKILMNAVKGMLPHNKLGRLILCHLKVYNGPDHPHAAQNPKNLEV